ncbi:hypothetical protein [Phenylobacterium sp.]|uniref:hypothetical protein n=1 Tax=Phenylobacterium sp. TaxID=1871053 RepID=UPI002737D41F|nr:hypothetical protein [Phenylobacterium sp.]MDP3868614.1 hypothetical protein [Phenylobacterium sp.]
MTDHSLLTKVKGLPGMEGYVGKLFKGSAIVAVIVGFASTAHALSPGGDWRLLDRDGQSETHIDVTSLSLSGRVRTAKFTPKSPLEALITTYAIDCSQKSFQAVEIWALASSGKSAQNLSNPGELTYVLKADMPRRLHKMMDAACKGVLPSGPSAVSIVPTYLDWKSRVG